MGGRWKAKAKEVRRDKRRFGEDRVEMDAKYADERHGV